MKPSLQPVVWGAVERFHMEPVIMNLHKQRQTIDEIIEFFVQSLTPVRLTHRQVYAVIRKHGERPWRGGKK